MHSKPQGFSTQPIVQPVTSMSVVSCSLRRYNGIHETFGHITQGVRQIEKGWADARTGRVGVTPGGSRGYMMMGGEHIARGVDARGTEA